MLINDNGLQNKQRDHTFAGNSMEASLEAAAAEQPGPLSAVRDNVGPGEGTSAPPLCVRKWTRLKWRASELNCSPLSLVSSH